MTTYEYPTLIGYHWNALQKISLAFGIPMETISISHTGDKCYVNFSVELTPEQKVTLDSIMANNPCSPPANTGGVTYRIVDIWGMRQWFITQIGIEPTYWFESEQSDGSGACYMYLQFPRALTTTEKRKVVDTYKACIGEVVM